MGISGLNMTYILIGKKNLIIVSQRLFSVHSLAKLRTANSLFFRPFVRLFMSCPTSHGHVG